MLLIISLGAIWLAMLLLGGGPVDRALLLGLYAADAPWLALAAMAFTYLGNGTTLIPITVAGALWLAYRRQMKAALLLLVATLTGRSIVVLEKWYLARLRPEEELRLVEVSSLSFPSGHAANSLMVFVGLALLVPRTPEGRRRAVPAALMLSFLIGLSRPMLGVHWPSDVVGGWAFGGLWLILAFALMERWRYGRPAEPKR